MAVWLGGGGYTIQLGQRSTAVAADSEPCSVNSINRNFHTSGTGRRLFLSIKCNCCAVGKQQAKKKNEIKVLWYTNFYHVS